MARVLLIEDNEMNSDMLTRRLERLGHDVLLASDGQTGVEMAKTHIPDLILMDMSLPVMDGWTATRTLKADEKVAHIPVLALTAHAIVGEKEKALGAGCDDYDTKPVRWDRLRGKMDTLLQGQG